MTIRREYIVGAIVIVLAGVAIATIFAGSSGKPTVSLGGTKVGEQPTSSSQPPSQGQTKGSAQIDQGPKVPYQEIVNPAGFVNTDGIKIGDLVGKKVVLLDFLTYSCINCQRTFPYLNAWYQKYKDQGLEIIGIHTPEFAFEKNRDNVVEAMKRFGINFPIVLDNNYATWNAYGNRFWPHKYLIDIHGNIVYDHIGEGAYDETEKKIRELLAERAKALGGAAPAAGSLAADAVPETQVDARSPETYFGFLRNEYLGNGKKQQAGTQEFRLPAQPEANVLYLNGTWDMQPEYAEALDTGSIMYRYNAQEVYLVMDAPSSVEVQVLQDGKPVGTAAGADVNSEGVVTVGESRLYKLVRNPQAGEHVLELKVRAKGLKAYAFTFG